MKLKIETDVEVDDFEIDRVIIEKAAENLLGQVELTARYGAAVSDLIQASLVEAVQTRVTAMLEKPIQARDVMGDPLGEPKMFKDILADKAEKFLTERVNSDGRAHTGYGSGSMSRLEYLLRDSIGRSMEEECRKVAADFRRELNEKAKVAIANAVASYVKVQA